VKILKRILLAFFVIILLAQIPFIYRRYQIGNLAAKITELEKGRVHRDDAQYKEYKGIIHAHTSLGGHSTGTFDELIAAANSNDLDFVLMTEHWSDAFDTSAMTLNGIYGKTLFVGGNEIDTADGDRFLMVPGSADAAGLRNFPTNAVVEKLQAESRLALITYPERFKSWDSNFDGIEVFSLHTNAKQMNPLTAFGDLIWSYPAYPELTLASYFKRPDANLQKFDEIAVKRKISLLAGTDAHSNIGFHLFGDDAGNKPINIKIDPYETMFGLTRAHVLIEKDRSMSRESLIEALKKGHSFIGFDVLGETSGFSFSAHNGSESVIMGDEINLKDGVQMKAVQPLGAHFIFFKNGERLPEKSFDVEAGLDVKEPGVYRVEAYRKSLRSPFDKMPWIISNPIYVR